VDYRAGNWSATETDASPYRSDCVDPLPHFRTVQKPKTERSIFRTLQEYEAILKRDCLQFGLTEEDVDDVVDAICAEGGLHRLYFLWRPVASDPDDDLILEAAIASHSDFIITFNKRDFPDSVRFGIRCLTPKEFLILLKELP